MRALARESELCHFSPRSCLPLAPLSSLRHADFDSYTRRLDNIRGKAETSDDMLSKAEAKVTGAKAALASSKTLVAASLAEAEQRRAALLNEVAYTLVACQVHFHRHVADVVSPLLPLFPQAASSLAELAGYTHVAANAARPKGYEPPPGAGTQKVSFAPAPGAAQRSEHSP